MRARDLVLHPTEARLRAPWRLGAHALGCVVASLALAAVARLASIGPFELWWTAQLVLVALVTLAAGAWIDRRRGWPRTLGLDRRGALDATAGALLGASLLGGLAAAEVALGFSTLRAAPHAPEAGRLALSVALFGAIAVSEELVFRAYQLTNLAEAFARVPERAGGAALAALTLASATFGLAHAGNPNASLVAVVNVTLAGVLLGLPFVLTGRLGFSIGLHFSWNLAQSLLDMPVSGQRVGVALVERTSAGAGEAWLTGGAFGPEGGVLGLVAIALGTALGAAWARASSGRLALAAGLGTPPPHQEEPVLLAEAPRV